MRVHPRAQIVSPMVFCVTAGLIAPGVVDASGSELCGRAPLANRVARTKIAAAPDHTPHASGLRACEGVSQLHRAGGTARLAPPMRCAPPLWLLSAASQPPAAAENAAGSTA